MSPLRDDVTLCLITVIIARFLMTELVTHITLYKNINFFKNDSELVYFL